MKPRLILLNLLLLAGIVVVVMQIRAQSEQARLVRQRNLNVVVKPIPTPAIAPVPLPDAPPATKYVGVAESNLFSKDRNATVIVEVPKIEPPKPMPPLPVVYGVMGLPSGAKAIMAERSGAATRPVRAGDTIGEFKVLKLDNRDVVFEWNGKEVPKKIEDLVDRSAALVAAGGQPSGPSGPAAPAPAAAAAAAPPVANTNPTSKDLGIELTADRRACKPGWQTDGIASGALVDGYRKAVTRSPFGEACRWVKQ